MNNPATFSGDMTIDAASLAVNGFALGAVRTERAGADYRLARTAAGELVLQRAYYWQQGSYGGIDWRTAPTVQLDAEGNAP